MGDPEFHMADRAWNKLSFPVSLHLKLQLFEVDRKKFHYLNFTSSLPKTIDSATFTYYFC